MFWPFSDWINCSINFKKFANSWPSALNFSKFFPITWTIFFRSRSEQYLSQRQQWSQIQKYWYFLALFWPFWVKIEYFHLHFSNFRHRQRHQWSQIRSYRRNQEEIKAERRFQLHQELKSTVRQRRERALQDFIRVNLRWVKNGQL